MSEVLSGESKQLEIPAEKWVKLAERHSDGLKAILHTLGDKVLADTLSIVYVAYDNGVEFSREGPLSEVAPVYLHPMNYVSLEDAKVAYPPAA